jgi:DNA replication protein DnaC
MTKETLQNLIDSTTNPEVIAMAKAELQKIELEEQASQGDALSQALLGLKGVVDSFKMSTPQGGGGLSSISKEEVEEMLKNYLAKSKISYDDLDIELRTKLAGQVKIQLALTTPTSQTLVNSATLLEQFERPLFQKVLSDWKARNNVYLFGGAGTGKTYMANQIADFLGYEYITNIVFILFDKK